MQQQTIKQTVVQQTGDAPKTLTAKELIALIQKQIDEHGNLPVYITDRQGELSLNNSSIRFSNSLAYKTTHGHAEKMNTYSGRFFVISDL